MTGDHLPIRGLRYPGGLLPRPGDPDGVLLLTSLYCRFIRYCSAARGPLLLCAWQFVSAAPLDFWVRKKTNSPRRQCLLSALQIYSKGCGWESACPAFG
ncbi:hypothetical protein SAM23877_7213 [Streptomyces ambofaciens ATCC 23877]|uniref:Uncharacterized protein n=1 Tax=Streptomyces ambofaciens (strain ATCC 23877 / 3486 / DSM 40053 / JCM 4204 / NBRC 12836 / NRRL B-2516) TaxID=278992 RepID=A0A0K2B543_STRA7|nr:hypothetical protein SAM23877_7213 [Streptomyces ambofaciens ATCC 23877]